MLGVVLWSDPRERKAVIWCEDHGDLAYYSQNDVTDCSVAAFEAGDLVQFDVTLTKNLRMADNPRRVAEKAYGDLAQFLMPTQPAGLSDNVVPFAPFRARTEDARPVRVQKPA